MRKSSFYSVLILLCFANLSSPATFSADQVQMCRSKESWKQQLQEATSAIMKNPLDKHNLCRRGLANDCLGDPEQAIDDFSKAIAIDPNYAEAYFSRGNSYLALSNNVRAIEDYSKAIELNLTPNLSDAYHNRALAYKGFEKQCSGEAGHEHQP